MYQIIILGCILFVTLRFLKTMRDPKLNMPPLVRYKIPIIGHTYDYLFNSEEFIRQCKKEYGDIFSLYIWGEVITFAGKESLHEVLTKDDVFDFGIAFEKRFPSDIVFKSISSTGVPTKIIKESVLNKLGIYNERLQKSLNLAIKKNIGDFDQKIVRNLSRLMTKIIAIPVANISIGEEESESEEILTTFAEFTTDTGTLLAIPPFLNLIYPGLQIYFNRISLQLGIYNPAVKHQKVLIKHIKNQVYKRLKEKQKFGDSWNRPDDFLQELTEKEKFDPNNDSCYSEIADIMCMFIFASIHTTSNGCTNAIVDLASRPEYMQELYEEQLEIHKEADENGLLPLDSLNKMKKLDSFIKESLRLIGQVTGLPHAVLKDYTFSNGLQVPKDHTVELYMDDIHLDESLQGSNPKSFDPFRHLNTNSSASKLGKNYVVFGGGKHACPGRFFAINEIKFFMHNIILNYNLRTESGKVEGKDRIGPLALPSSCGIIFEKRN